jgi:microcystin-dependent protein
MRNIFIKSILALSILGIFTFTQNANAQEPFIGEVRVFPYHFAPRGWAICNGQLLPIADNTALFSLIGTIYGGDGRTTFGLPNLQGRAALHPGAGPGLTPRSIGSKGGSEQVTLSEARMPRHNHQAVAGDSADTESANNSTWAAKERTKLYKSGPSNLTAMDQTAISNTGGSEAHNNMPPYLTMGYYIALQGIYPSRD